jgi:hypothetical protein
MSSLDIFQFAGIGCFLMVGVLWLARKPAAPQGGARWRRLTGPGRQPPASRPALIRRNARRSFRAPLAPSRRGQFHQLEGLA